LHQNLYYNIINTNNNILTPFSTTTSLPINNAPITTITTSYSTTESNLEKQNTQLQTENKELKERIVLLENQINKLTLRIDEMLKLMKAQQMKNNRSSNASSQGLLKKRKLDTSNSLKTITSINAASSSTSFSNSTSSMVVSDHSSLLLAPTSTFNKNANPQAQHLSTSSSSKLCSMLLDEEKSENLSMSDVTNNSTNQINLQ
jgi:hypothetical protein